MKRTTLRTVGGVKRFECLDIHPASSDATTIAQGAAVGFFNWLGFVFVTNLEEYGAVKYPFKLVAIKTGGYLIELLVMGAILAALV